LTFWKTSNKETKYTKHINLKLTVVVALLNIFATAKAADGDGFERRFAVSARFNVIRPTESTTGGAVAYSKQQSVERQLIYY